MINMKLSTHKMFVIENYKEHVRLHRVWNVKNHFQLKNDSPSYSFHFIVLYFHFYLYHIISNKYLQLSFKVKTSNDIWCVLFSSSTMTSCILFDWNHVIKVCVGKTYSLLLPNDWLIINFFRIPIFYLHLRLIIK